MSMGALLEAVATKLRTATGLPAGNVDVRDDGEPPNFAGELFIAVHPGSIGSDATECLDESYSITVTITRRRGYIPDDKVGQEMITNRRTGLYYRVDQVRAALHGKWDYILPVSDETTANGIIGALANGFIETLAYRGCSVPRKVGAEWFGGGGDREAGSVVEMTFDRARRVQTIESQE